MSNATRVTALAQRIAAVIKANEQTASNRYADQQSENSRTNTRLSALFEVASGSSNVVQSAFGMLSQLSTSTKASLIAAINEIHDRVPTIAAQNVALANGYVGFGTTPYYETVNGWGLLGGSVERSSGTAFASGVNVQIGTIPSRDAPASNLRFVMAGGPPNLFANVIVFADGRITVQPSGNMTFISLNATWPRDAS